MRMCWNWQTSKTKDLVGGIARAGSSPAIRIDISIFIQLNGVISNLLKLTDYDIDYDGIHNRPQI